MDENKTEIIIKNFPEYVSILDQIENPDSFFRGQGEDWPLLPKIARDPKLDGEAIIKLEKDTFEKFKRMGRPFFQFNPDITDPLEILMIGQHYGLPTRLMDWTANPLAALWFAVKEIPKIKSEYGVVWIYNPHPNDDAYRTGYADSELTDIPRTLHFLPAHVDQRLIVQKSVFTIHGSGESNQKKKFIPLQEEKLGALQKVRIPSKIADELLNKLERCGIDEASMFPGLDGLCRKIDQEGQTKKTWWGILQQNNHIAGHVSSRNFLHVLI